MPKNKIIIENIDDNDNKNHDVIDTSESVDTKPPAIEKQEEVIEQQEEVIEKQEEVIETEQVKPEHEPVETQKKTRLQELIQCPKCNKMVTIKTLKYSHKKNL